MISSKALKAITTFACLMTLGGNVAARTPQDTYRECIDTRIMKYKSAGIEIRSLAEAIYGSCTGEADRAFMLEQEEPMIGGQRAILANRPWDAEMEARRSVEADREILYIMGRILLSR